MRYRIRPSSSSEEVPTKYNMYNAKVESLDNKNTWSKLISNNHAIIPMNGFKEWISTEKGKKICQFSIANQEIFWVAALFDIWEDPKTKEKLLSFAIITGPPTSAIQEVGHDRCPIILSKEKASLWLDTSKLDVSSSLEILKGRSTLEINHQFTH